MKRYVEGQDRSQATLFPESLDEYIAEDNPVRVVDVFVDELNLKDLGFEGAEREVTGRPCYHPGTLLKIYIYGYLNRVQSSRRLEREAQRNVELIWLTGRLALDFKTIADFRKDNGPAIRRVCREFVLLGLNLFCDALVAIDGSKFKAVNGRDRNFTKHKLKARMQQLEESIARYLADLDRADRDPSSVTEARVERLKEKVETVKAPMRRLKQLGKQMAEAPDEQISLTDPDARSMATSARSSGVVGYNVQTAVDAKHHLVLTREVTNQGTDRAQLASMGKQTQEALGTQKLTALADRGYYAGPEILECEQAGINTRSGTGGDAGALREDAECSAHPPQTAEHVFGTLKSWMGATHFLMKRLPNVKTEMSLHVLAYNLKRAMQIFGVVPLIRAIRA
jgi:transposase